MATRERSDHVWSVPKAVISRTEVGGRVYAAVVVGREIMNGNRLEKYLEYVYPEPKDRLPTESETECIARDRSWSEYFFDQGAGNRLRGVEGTLWAAYNGVTEYLDHRKISTPKVLMREEKGCLDADILYANGKWHMVYRYFGIWMRTADHALGPYVPAVC